MINKIFGSRIGLALGGGGARGIAHIGVLKAISESHQELSCIAGTSAGALVATLYAFGVPWYKIKEIFSSLSISKIGVLNFGSAGLMSGTRIAGVVRETIGDVDISEARIPLGIVCCDLKSGRNIVLTEGPAALLVQASGAFPGLFSPVEYKGMVLVDGFLTENVPVSAVRKLGANFVVSVNLSALTYQAPETMGIKDVLNRSFDILVDPPDRKKSSSSYSINLDMSFVDRFKITEIDRAVDIGYDHARRMLNQSPAYWITRPIRVYIISISFSIRKLLFAFLKTLGIRLPLFRKITGSTSSSLQEEASNTTPEPM